MSTINTRAQVTDRHAALLPRFVRVGANAAIVGLWLWLYWPVFDYLSIIFTQEDFRTNQVVLVGVIVLIATQARRERVCLRFDAAPWLSPLALLLVLGCSTIYLVVERYLDVNTLSASLFGLASYGLLGLWMAPRRWRQGLPAALLLVGTLPFGEHMQTFVGYPVRILTAGIVRDGLAAAGVESIGVDTILVLENGVSQVDLPCSGIKSLWTGMLFLIAATWIDRRPLDLRWLFTVLVFIALLFTANLARVGVLVVVGQVAGWRLLAEMLHVPLGVLGFAGACAAAVALLRLRRPVPRDMRGERNAWDAVLAPARPAWLAPTLVVVILAMALIYTPRPQTGLAGPRSAWEFPADLVTEPMPLTPQEIEWLTRDGAESADRRRFEWRGITGSMLLVTSTTWRAHHRPERCLEVLGLSIVDSRPHLVAPDFPVRFVSLGDRDGRNLATATYWFQSADRITDDYGARIWADLSLHRDRWVLVTILFDRDYNPRTIDVQTFYEAVARGLEKGLSS